MIPKAILSHVNWPKQIKESILIAVIGGLVQGFFSYNEFFRGELSVDIFVFSWSATIWLALWKGNQVLVVVIDHFISWLEEPGKRFLTGLLCMLIYTIIISLVIYWFFFGVIWGQDIVTQIKSNLAPFIYTPVGITSTIMVVSHSTAFLRAWRQSAINFEKLKKEKLLVEYEALKNQVNPHFLFNSMNVLTSLVYEDQDKAVKFIRELSKVYRYVLDSRQKNLVALEEELEFIDSYIFLQKIRFENNLIVDIDINTEVLDKLIPPMALQLLLENAIKHNVVSERKPLTVRIKSEDNQLIIENNLQEKLTKDSTGIGLENLKQRYQIISKAEILVKRDDSHFTVIIPILHKHDEEVLQQTLETETT